MNITATSADVYNDIDISVRIKAKQIDLLYENQLFAVIATVLVLSLTFVFLYSESIKNTFFITGGLFTAVYSYRFFINWKYFQNKQNKKLDIDLSDNRYLIGVVLSGVAWAIGVISIFPNIEIHGQILLFIVLMGLSAAAHTTMGYRLKPIVSFIVILLFSLLYSLYISDFPNMLAMMIAIVVYATFLLRASFLFYNSTYKMLRANEIATLRENELEMQSDMANNASKEKSVFLSRMSHELRTPLNAVLGMNELLLRNTVEPLTEKQRGRIEKADEAGKHLLSIVDDVLDISRIESGEMDVMPELVNCESIIGESIKIIEDKAAERNITVTTEMTGDDLFILADPKRLKQVLVNLLDNGVKYNKRGGVITIFVNDQENGFVRISIVDTGYGIKDEYLDNLFKPFSRLGADDLGIDGTGIGLSLCKWLVELMQGRIGIKNKQGEGCCFWIELPFVINEGEKVVDNKQEVPEIMMRSENKKKILLVEDNLVNCEVAVDMLDELGFDADVVNNGEEAVKTFDHGEHSLILMDCEMPVMDGFKATVSIRSIENESDMNPIPIIALTAHAITGAKEKCIVSGMNDFLSKPFNMSTLNIMLKKWIINEEDISAPERISVTHSEITEGDETDGGEIIDHNTITRLRSRNQQDGSCLFDKIVKIYLQQSSELLIELTKATSLSDIEKVRSITHALKSSSSNVGALSLSAVCKKVEHHCEMGEIEPSLIEQVHLCYADVKDALNSAVLNN